MRFTNEKEAIAFVTASLDRKIAKASLSHDFRMVGILWQIRQALQSLER